MIATRISIRPFRCLFFKKTGGAPPRSSIADTGTFYHRAQAKSGRAAARAFGLKYFLLPKIIEVIPRNIQIIRWNSKSVKFLF
jgi:hypothetical protein